jgi:hypothetical protein
MQPWSADGDSGCESVCNNVLPVCRRVHHQRVKQPASGTFLCEGGEDGWNTTSILLWAPPANAYVALDDRLSLCPSRDIALVWDEEHIHG